MTPNKKSKRAVRRSRPPPLSKAPIGIQCLDELASDGRLVPVVECGYMNLYGGDVTEQRRVQEAPRENHAHLSKALQMARTGHWVYDVASDVFTFNDNFYRIFRTSVTEVGGYQISSSDYARRFCHPEDAAAVVEETKAAIESPDPDYCRQLSERVSAVKPGVKVLFMPGYPADVIARRSVPEQNVAFLGKPFPREDLARKVREVLGI